MKTNALVPVLILLSSCMLSSCGCRCEADFVRSYHLIDYYNEWSSFKLSHNKKYGDDIHMHFNTEHIYYSAEAEKFLHSTQSADDLARFHELAAKNGDVGYDWSKYCLPGDFPRMAIYPGITGIMITSDHDYDDSHPAGTSLNDIFNAHYFSYTQFLGDADHSDVDPTHNYLGVTDKSCDTIGEDELYVMSPNYFSIQPQHAPTAWKDQHLLTVTLTDENGKEHSAAIEMDFDSF